jgi:hypothetical protein
MRKKKSLIIRKEENPFKPGDVGFIGLGAVSRKSMAFWVSKKRNISVSLPLETQIRGYIKNSRRVLLCLS